MIKSKIKNMVKTIIKSFKKVGWRCMDTGPIDVHMNGQIHRIIRFFGFTVSGKLDGQKGKGGGISTPVFYLKINREAPYTLECIQMWLDIAAQMGADYYIVCDNKWLEHKVLKTCLFEDRNIKFIPSYGRSLRQTADRLYTGNWRFATHAHLTPFYHAKKMGYQSFWSVDADDTSFLMEYERTSQALIQVEQYVKEKGVSAMSLDMWFSRTHGKHWSFGVTFINDNVGFIDIFQNTVSKEWMKHYQEMETAFNLDWFFTYLKDFEDIKIETFYIERCWFIHWGNSLINPFYSWVNYWENGKIHYPILEGIYHNKEAGCLDIADAVRIDVRATRDEGMRILENRICKSRYFQSQQRRLFQNQDFAGDKDYLRF